MTPHRSELSGLDSLEQRLAQDLTWLNLPPKAWIPARQVAGEEVLDVAVVGGGMLGLVTLAALQRAGIFRIRAFDRAPEGREGPWITYARMETLRTRKEAAGPALGLPSLTFRAWFEVQFGREAWEAMDYIPRAQWMEYLVWYRRVLDLPVENDTQVRAVTPREDGLIELVVEGAGGTRRVLARRAVLATGLDGLGAPALPEIARSVPARFVAHGADMIDMAALKGKRVAVIGAGSSAMDNAATALEEGAAQVDIFARRPRIPFVDKFSGTGSIGMTLGYQSLPDETKWAFMREGERIQIPPPRHSVQRVARHDNARFHVGSPVEALEQTGEAVTITTPKGRYEVDFVIFATGFAVDLDARPEFAALKDRFVTWGEAYTPAPGEAHAGLAGMPYLGRAFDFVPKVEGDPIAHVHCFAFPAVMSQGKITSGIPAISEGALRMTHGIAASIFAEDRAAHLDRFMSYDTPELRLGDYTDADADPAAAVSKDNADA